MTKEFMKEGLHPFDRQARINCKKRWDSIAKPLDSLGLFEDMIGKIAGIQGSESVKLDKKAVVIMCSDNGVVEEGVTQTDSSVTAIVTENFAKGTATVNIMSREVKADVFPIDIGINRNLNHPGVLNRKVSYGTKNIAKGPAMTEEQVIQAIYTGMEFVRTLKDEGYQIIGTGEMGIGNTTTSSALASVLLGLPVEAVTGKGAGLSGEGIKRKIEVIQEAIRINNPDPANPLEVLEKLGGYDIAGITGLFLGGARYGMPIVIDGVISSIAALLAARMEKEAITYMLPSHMSKEPASSKIMAELGLTPVIHGGLALGEGTGTTLLFSMLDIILKIYHGSNTFEDIQVKAYENFNPS